MDAPEGVYAAYSKLTSPSCPQNSQTSSSSYPSHLRFTPLAKKNQNESTTKFIKIHSQPTYLRKICTIHPTHPKRSSSILSLFKFPVNIIYYTRLKISIRHISHPSTFL